MSANIAALHASGTYYSLSTGRSEANTGSFTCQTTLGSVYSLLAVNVQSKDTDHRV